jgi:hypothetical protein
MSKSKGIFLRIGVAAAFVAAISYFSDAGFYLALIIVAALGLCAEIIHMPENMPRGADNPDGEELHPAITIFLALGIMAALIALGEFFPGLYSYGFSQTS